MNSALHASVKGIEILPEFDPDLKNVLDRYFDIDYVNTDLRINIIERYLDLAQSYINALEKEFENHSDYDCTMHVTYNKTTTVQEPFNLTAPKMKIQKIELAPEP